MRQSKARIQGSNSASCSPTLSVLFWSHSSTLRQTDLSIVSKSTHACGNLPVSTRSAKAFTKTSEKHIFVTAQIARKTVRSSSDGDVWEPHTSVQKLARQVCKCTDRSCPLPITFDDWLPNTCWTILVCHKYMAAPLMATWHLACFVWQKESFTRSNWKIERLKGSIHFDSAFTCNNWLPL